MSFSDTRERFTTGADIFFLKSDLNWPFFFTHSNTLESHVIKEGQENLKTQKFVQEMREITITIYLCTHTCTYKF